jgi:hypothetical protein
MEKLNQFLFKPVSPVSSGLFRIVFGMLMFFQFYYVEAYIVDNLTLSKFFLKYDFFTWVTITSPENLRILFVLAMVFSVFYTVGFLYRLSSVFMFLIWTYIFLLDVGHYNNHYYLNCLLLFVSIFVNADSFLSIRSIFNGVKQVPSWNVEFFKFQMFLVYFYGAVAKLNSDWLKGLPLQYWLGEDFSLLGVVSPGYSFVFMAWFGLFFDFFVGFMLFHKKLKYYSLFFIIPFHVTNHFIWNIGIFPWMAIGICFFYFNEELTDLFKRFKNYEFTKPKEISPVFKNTGAILIVFYFIVQFLMPLRQHLIPEETTWNGYGNYFAWRMMLSDKQGAARVAIYSENNQKLGDVVIENYMNVLQFARMIHIPMHFIRFAHFLDSEIKKHPGNASLGDIKVKVFAFKTINNRPFSLLIDSTLDLSNEEYKIFNKGRFLIPYEEKEVKKELDVIYEDEYLQFK